MSKNRPNRPDFQDIVVARALTVGSAVGAYVPALRCAITGQQSPNHVDARWMVASERADSIEDWVEFPAYSQSGRTPRSYRRAAVLELNKAIFDTVREQIGGVHAVAYGLGSAAMVGVMETRSTFEPNPDDPENYQVAMGIGRGVLRATAGLWLGDRRDFVVPHDAIAAGMVYEIPDLPRHIPLV